MAVIERHLLRDDLPAAAGGRPMFAGRLPLVRPSVPSWDDLSPRLRSILASGALTNGPLVREFESRTADYLGVRNCVAVSSCTSGLMLVLRATGMTGSVVVPSFTFAATAHAVAWNRLRPVFADIDPDTLTLSPASVRTRAGRRTSAILATHIYGTPCDADALAAVARERGLRLFFDAAHAFGSRRAGTPIGGFGDAEVFSLSPTKVLIAGEGGLVATNDDVLAEQVRIGRDYGNPGDYDCRFVGLNARMSEFHAALALESLEGIEGRIAERNSLASEYRAALATIPGIAYPSVRTGDRSTYKDFTILVDEAEFGMDAARLGAALSAEGIDTRRYYSPAVHTTHAYRPAGRRPPRLPVTELASRRVLTLPLWSGLPLEDLARVAQAVRRIQAFAASNGHDAMDVSTGKRLGGFSAVFGTPSSG